MQYDLQPHICGNNYCGFVGLPSITCVIIVYGVRNIPYSGKVSNGLKFLAFHWPDADTKIRSCENLDM